MDTINKYKNVTFESSSSRTPEFNSFAKSLKREIKRKLPDIIELHFNVGHFYLSGFIKNNDSNKFAYFMTSDIRPSVPNNVLVRSATGLKDFTGGPNKFVSWDTFIDELVSLTY